MRDQHSTDAQTARLINLGQVVRQTCGDFALVGSRLTTSAALRAMAATSAGVPRAGKARRSPSLSVRLASAFITPLKMSELAAVAP